MTNFHAIPVNDQDLQISLNGFLKAVLQAESVSGVLAPMRLPMKQRIMPTLITDPARIDEVDLLSPCFPLNAARLVSRLTRKPMGAGIAVVLRPCEIRAFVELVKLNQGRTDDVLIIGMDCLGAVDRQGETAFLGEDGADATKRFYAQVLWGSGDEKADEPLATACRMCAAPVPDGADVALQLFGMLPEGPIRVQATTPKGKALMASLQLKDVEESPERQDALEALMEKRRVTAEAILADVEAATRTPDALRDYVADCINCYNCRVACPVCYCRECVFVTDVFDHDPLQYLEWAARKGALKLPTDTLFYHLTRLTHMSTACVGCGQCSRACPNQVPVAELFISIARRTQAAFDYEAGRRLDEKPPMSVFEKKEFEEVVGI